MRVGFALLLLSLLNLPAQAAEPTVLDAEAGFPEGPLMKNGTLYYAQYGAHKVSRWDGASSSVLWSKDGCGPSAVIEMGEGFAVTCYDSGEMVRISATGETIDAQAKDSSGGALVGPNDGTRTVRAAFISRRRAPGNRHRSSGVCCTWRKTAQSARSPMICTMPMA